MESRARAIALFGADSARANHLNRATEAQLALEEMSGAATLEGIDADWGVAIVRGAGGEAIAAGELITTGGIAAGQAIDGAGSVVDAMPRPRRKQEDIPPLPPPVGKFLWIYTIDNQTYLGGKTARLALEDSPLIPIQIHQINGVRFIANLASIQKPTTITVLNQAGISEIESSRTYGPIPVGYGLLVGVAIPQVQLTESNQIELVQPSQLSASGDFRFSPDGSGSIEWDYSGTIEGISIDTNDEAIAFEGGTFSVFQGFYPTYIEDGTVVASEFDYNISIEGRQFILKSVNIPFSMRQSISSSSVQGGSSSYSYNVDFDWHQTLLIDQSQSRALVYRAIGGQSGLESPNRFATYGEGLVNGVWLYENDEFIACNNIPFFHALIDAEAVSPPVANEIHTYTKGTGLAALEADTGSGEHPLWDKLIGLQVIVSVLEEGQAEGGTRAIKGFGTIVDAAYDLIIEPLLPESRIYTSITVEFDRVVRVPWDYWATENGTIVSNTGSIHDLLQQLNRNSMGYYPASIYRPDGRTGEGMAGLPIVGLKVIDLPQRSTWIGNRVYIATPIPNQPELAATDYAGAWTMSLDEDGVYQFRRADQPESSMRTPLTLVGESFDQYGELGNYYPI
ncbi:hypothetical protein IQ268_08460 [Oculatella sp. LEGE 06141]|uniref:hypothetical protein n=1 Tax=Oculatella sp. LEGE 06141 TaxID=1828648 RepID=UPI001882AFB8|nr:hypothetical protein [Oculatella sp. LEGE 06141]MBE9178589.1 hypothetical protein [Oculatella sp. LEGE 06141]